MSFVFPEHLGWIPSPRDPRDYRFGVDIRPAQLQADAMGLAPFVPVAPAQSGGSCVGFASKNLLETVWAAAGYRQTTLSGMHVYAHARGPTGIQYDSGTSCRAGCAALRATGDAALAVWPTTDFRVWPSAESDLEGQTRRSVEYLSVQSPWTVDPILAALVAGYPVIIGMNILRSWQTPVDNTIPLPGAAGMDSSIWGGHAILVWGYSYSRQCVRILNSWGTGWGGSNDGQCWLPVAMFNQISEAYTIRVATYPVAPVVPVPAPVPKSALQNASDTLQLMLGRQFYWSVPMLTQAQIDEVKRQETTLKGYLDALIADTPAPVPTPTPTPTPNPTPSPTGTNVALASNGAVASSAINAGPGYPVQSINNGERTGKNWGQGGGWQNAVVWQYGDGVTITFNGAQMINRVVVYSMQNDYRNPVEPTDTLTFIYNGVIDFRVEAWNGTAWAVLSTVTGNALVKRTVSFPSTATDKIRIVPTRTPNGWACIVEVEAWTA